MNLTSSGESYCFFPKYIYLCHLKSEQCRQVPNITDFQNFSFPSGSKPVLGESLYPSILILKLSFYLLYSSENSRLFFLILWDKKKKKSQKPKRERERCSQEISSVLRERCHAVIFLTSKRSISGQPAAQSCLGDFQSLRTFQLPHYLSLMALVLTLTIQLLCLHTSQLHFRMEEEEKRVTEERCVFVCVCAF